MRIGRTIPPAAAPLGAADVWYGLGGMRRPHDALASLEAEIARTFGVSRVFLLSSGTAALTVALKALASLSLRTEVVVPAYTCYTVPAAVAAAGLRPVLCDLAPSSFDFDHARLTEVVTERTLCVVAHHLFGIPSDVERVRTICAAHGAYVVEDAAQAMGVKCDGRMLGTLGDVGIFSLGRGKQVTCGDGGVIVTDDAALGRALDREYAAVPAAGTGRAALDLLKVVAMALCVRPTMYWIPASLPFLRLGETIYPTRVVPRRLSGLQAGLMRRMRFRMQRARRGRLDTSRELRRRVGLGLAVTASHPYLRLPVFATSREDKRELLEEAGRRGLGISGGYPAPINEIPQIAGLFTGQQFPQASFTAAHLLTIPTHHWLTGADIHAIASHLSGRVSASCSGEPDDRAVSTGPHRPGAQAATAARKTRASMISNALTVDVEEYFHAAIFQRGTKGIPVSRFESRVERNTDQLLELMERHGARGTFFVLGEVAALHPAMVRRIAEQGHEVGCHSDRHRDVYQQTPIEFREDVRRAKACIEGVLGEAIVGYRAPNFSIRREQGWAFQILLEEGFRYDSSVYPIVHDRYGVHTAPRFPYEIWRDGASSLIEFPISTTRLFGWNLPIGGGGYFRLAPYGLSRLGIQRVNGDEQQPVMFYLHPWELDPNQPRPPMPWRDAFRHYVGVSKQVGKLSQLLAHFHFSTVRDVLDHYPRPVAPPVVSPFEFTVPLPRA
jgi:polysaccharide deacetylase family protein (PEP-CTERM system associated)